MATGAPIIVGFASLNPTRRPRYRVEFDPPILPQGNDDAERIRLTRLISDRISAFILSHPDQWFVFQPKWVTRDVA
jgi:lauroyl/myristoyl acyltransferase